MEVMEFRAALYQDRDNLRVLAAAAEELKLSYAVCQRLDAVVDLLDEIDGRLQTELGRSFR